RKLFPGLEAGNDIVLDLELDAALHAAETAVRLHDLVGFAGGSAPPARRILPVRAELLDDFQGRCRLGRHLTPSARRRPGPAPAALAGIWDRSTGSVRWANPSSR